MDPISYIKSYINSSSYKNKLANTDFSGLPITKQNYINTARRRINSVKIEPFHNDTGLKAFWNVLSNKPVRSYNTNITKKAINGSNADVNANIVYMDSNPGDKNYSNYNDILSHELGHIADGSLQGMNNYFDTKNVPNDYIKVARKQNIKNKQYDFDKTKSLDNWHDKNYHEIYGDLMQLRYQLYNNGIYDSRSKNKFNINHLNKFKQTKPKDNRILKGFKDNDIIWMINNIAQNDKTNSNYHLEDLPYKNEYL